MGCDIHGHFEVKIKGKWEHYTTDNFQRDYRLFAKLAGVRNEYGIKPIAHPRGIPKDISIITRIDADIWTDGGHSHSYIIAKEIAEVYKFHTGYNPNLYTSHIQWGYLFGNGFESFLTSRSNYPLEIEDLRFVFWFDN